MKKKLIHTTLFTFLSAWLVAQEPTDADSTSVGYQVGYQIGSLLPFIVIVAIGALIILRSYDFSSYRKNK